jgi:hypothetical protein
MNRAGKIGNGGGALFQSLLADKMCRHGNIQDNGIQRNGIPRDGIQRDGAAGQPLRNLKAAFSRCAPPVACRALHALHPAMGAGRVKSAGHGLSRP